jgi:2,4-dienoyl-CoA reductase [(3E)-enoyl-CoA-producing], peroxisomal
MAQLSANAFKTVQEIDVMGSYNVTKVCMPHLLASAKKWNDHGALPKDESGMAGPGGRIIYVSATLHYVGTPLQTHVVVAKAGVDALSNNVAIEYGPLGITSNVIAPGPIGDTEGMNRLAKATPKDQLPSRLKKIPLGRYGKVKEISDATVFLFSDTGNYVTGQCTIVDGGSWRTGIGSGGDFPYPDFLLSGDEITGVGGSKRKATSSKL